MTAALEQAYAECTTLAESHYENFPVGWLVPSHLQKHVHAVYAFARTADDFADEGYDQADPWTPDRRLAALHDWEAQLFTATPTNRIFLAVQDTIQKLDLPVSLFTDLLSAFQQDVVKPRYANFPEVLDYCRRSANPVGRLVLLLHGRREPYQHELSDCICTGLQLANFWQDVSVDLLKDRIYLPQDEQMLFGVHESDLFAGRVTPEYRRLLRFQVERTRELFARGALLPPLLEPKLAWEIRLTWHGGSSILDAIEALDYNTLQHRPKLSKLDLFRLAAQSWLSA
jgi:phytoene synthase